MKTSAVKSGNFSAEVCQLLTRSFTSRRVADFCPCSPLGKMDASVWASGLLVVESGLRVSRFRLCVEPVVFCVLLNGTGGFV
ncbi:MAG: hypothetical protein IKT83_00485 [Bacteroidaceae bacterium]|nr:hypothetical protein [Bacteroidaceae bacterium]